MNTASKEKYADGSPLVQELTRWFENHRILFLGCSLNVDRTMDVLKNVTLDQPSIRHYAILGCEKSDIPKRLKELNDLGILPVFYDRKDHDAVRVILERLLEDTDQNSYKKLWAASQTAPVAAKEERRLLFDSDFFPFTGRKQELESLEAFCASNEVISWWAVTGPGGMGKSRLVYEFTNQMREEGWKIERFEAHPSKDSRAGDLVNLSMWLPETSRTIVVLDDVQSHMEQVRQWLNEVVRDPRSEKLRILLLEREGEDLNSASWLGADPCEDVPVEWCHDKSFLYLEPLTDADLIAIMDDYAVAAGKELNAELLLKTLERVDPELKRPLYAIAIADARCQGKDPTSWDRKKVLDTLLNRELDFHLNRLQGMTGKKATKTLRSELEDLLARSCISGFLFLDDVEIERYPKLTKKIENLDMDLQEFLEGLGILRSIRLLSFTLDQFGNPISESSEEQSEVVALSCPDLIKEHLVLNLTLEDGKRELLFPQGWEQDPGRIFFLRQLLVDYSDRLKEQSEYWKSFFQVSPQNIFVARVYGNILWGYTAYYPDDAGVAIDRLEQLYDKMKQDPKIAISYARGLVNLTVKQDLKGCTETVALLDKLYQSHSDFSEVTGAYAKVLVNLSVDQDLKERTETVAQLDKLYQRHSDLPEVADAYAKVLVNLTVDQDLKERTETVARLDELYRNHPDIPEVAVERAKGLVNLTAVQDSEECMETIAQLEELYRNYSEIAATYAKGLVNLTVVQDLKVRAETIARLDELYQRHPDSQDVTIEYAKGLSNLTIDQDLKGCVETVAQADMLYQSHSDSEDVAAEFAGCLVHLALRQKSESEVRNTLARSRAILDRYPKNSNIQLRHAMTWFNLTLQQHEADIPATVTDIIKFLHTRADIIPQFKEALDEYLSAHPDHAIRYQPLTAFIRSVHTDLRSGIIRDE